LAPQIRAAADEIERMRRLPLPLVEALARAGLFRLWIPRVLGGEETDLMTLVRVVEEVARADGAAGWCDAIGGEYGAFGGYLPRDAARGLRGTGSHDYSVTDLFVPATHSLSFREPPSGPRAALCLTPPNYQMAGQAFLDLDMRATPLLLLDDRSVG
jgi:Acyl-CoA dehydrogenase, N-terminal domain